MSLGVLVLILAGVFILCVAGGLLWIFFSVRGVQKRESPIEPVDDPEAGAMSAHNWREIAALGTEQPLN